MGHIAGIASAVIGATSSAISLALGTLIGQLYNGTVFPVTIGFLLLGLISLLIMRQTEEKKQVEAAAT
jgi:DHA1 family bicyclomycin/chloramphenicol resistance-like MFS transporter